MVGQRIRVKGEGAPGTMIKIVKAGDGNVVLSPFVNVTDQGTWEVTLNTDLPFGDYSIMAQMSWSGYLSAFSPGVPLNGWDTHDHLAHF